MLHYLDIFPDVKKHHVFAPLRSALSVALYRLKTGCCGRYPAAACRGTEPAPACPTSHSQPRQELPCVPERITLPASD